MIYSLLIAHISFVIRAPRVGYAGIRGDTRGEMLARFPASQRLFSWATVCATYSQLRAQSKIHQRQLVCTNFILCGQFLLFSFKGIVFVFFCVFS